MKILFITLSNIGDVILTLPVLDYLLDKFKGAQVTCLVAARPKEIFEGNPAITRLIIYDKHSRLREKISLFRQLAREKFDLVVDLRNSFYGAFLPAKQKSSFFRFFPSQFKHMRERHFLRAGYPAAGPIESSRHFFNPQPEDAKYIEELLARNRGQRLIALAAGARSGIKRWSKENFSSLSKKLLEDGFQVILVGDEADLAVAKYIEDECANKILNLCGKTNLRELGCLLGKTDLLITNDSAISHLASYLNLPVLAVFGPTNEEKYGPWPQKKAVVKKEIFCRPCEKAECYSENLACMSLIKVEDVFKAAKKMLSTDYGLRTTDYPDFKRILITRTDRIGDVLLSTPVIKALRDNYPNAYIAMMVSPYARDIVQGNPNLDEVIILDKDGPHKGFPATLKLAKKIEEKRFDLALILHPTNRVHLITFLAGIPKRIGYDRKLGFLLTDRIKHTKQEGQKHESEYNFDLLKVLGINEGDKSLSIPLKAESEKWAEDLFANEGIKISDKLLVINPTASCPSKIWPAERFAQTANELAKRHGFKLLLVAAAKDTAVAQKVIRNLQSPVIDLSGKTSISQLASLIKRCALFISNDSGPVHIASAVGTPVISIFGRNQKGLSPRRWGPLGKKDKFLHKPAGCISCLAHNCQKDFACLKAITVEDVINAAGEILG